MTENGKQKRIEQLKRELKIRKGIVEFNTLFVKQLEKAIEELENATA